MASSSLLQKTVVTPGHLTRSLAARRNGSLYRATAAALGQHFDIQLPGFHRAVHAEFRIQGGSHHRDGRVDAVLWMVPDTRSARQRAGAHKQAQE